ncbi:5'-3' exoribonuclease 2 homolog [Condylostylus longicornis]|uniref:5'-3' exoribonuclease 2 homolog n=1 Tax=Condylostylus longicornis TaxID=2530218 RepID=UPI00244E4627|nr:5'-3' exoribonuclease 2 homolog [Condylostylus longicornis]
MGVPAFFRWLSRKYPSVIVDCVEVKTVDDNGKNVYDDMTKPNPNGVEFDNLYLDMNGIIHPCTHPEDKPPPKNEDEMMVAIFECIDRLMNIVRPRKILYMAIDGVAPRAKMNQQRSRRFRAAKESIERRNEIARIRSELLAKGCRLPPEKPKEEHFDSNCITPGTPFMERLSRCLHYYIHDRMNTNPAWKSIKVILSDANVPGEGEHKIMDFIRKQRSQPDHDPNTQHVLCGADADLIMLGLATHEPNFTIIREEFLPNKPKPCDICGQYGHEVEKCQGLDADIKIDDAPIVGEVRFIFVRLFVLREYLKTTLEMPNLPFPYDFDRAVDDWVFMCFFVGNDFLPHLPSLEIREGAIDRLVELYKKCVYKTGGFLTDSGEVNLNRVQLIMDDLGSVEDTIFRERQRREENFKAREKAKKRRMESQVPNFANMHNSQFAPTPLGKGITPAPIQNARQEAANFRRMDMVETSQYNKPIEKDGKAALEALLRPSKSLKRKSDEIDEKQQPETVEEEEEEDYQENDEVRLWEEGFKDRYYESKFDVGPDNINFRYSVALQYVRGLCWVLKYYYQGCASWKWYFPYHYAPFASDFVNVRGLSTKFEKNTKPFNPLEQLMGVFPAASSSHVPQPWANLMSDPKSPIIDFYPEDFKIDLNGKKFAWQGVALLPFVDEKRLFKALKPFYSMLTEQEVKRNKCGDSRLYITAGNPGFSVIKSHYKNKIFQTVEVPVSIQGMQGRILWSDDNVALKGICTSPIKGLTDIKGNNVLTVKYRDPKYDDDFIFPARRLPNAIDPPAVLKPEGANPNYRPTIGFRQNSQSASLDVAGHRMLNHYVGQQQFNQNSYQNFNQNFNQNRNSNYASIPPPTRMNSNYRSNNYGYQQGGRNNYNPATNNYGNNYGNNNRNNSNNSNTANTGYGNNHNNNNNNNNAGSSGMWVQGGANKSGNNNNNNNRSQQPSTYGEYRRQNPNSQYDSGNNRNFNQNSRGGSGNFGNFNQNQNRGGSGNYGSYENRRRY